MSVAHCNDNNSAYKLHGKIVVMHYSSTVECIRALFEWQSGSMLFHIIVQDETEHSEYLHIMFM